MADESISYHDDDDDHDDDDEEERNLWSFKLKNDLNKVPVILLPTNPASV